MTHCEATGRLGISSLTLCKLLKNKNDLEYNFLPMRTAIGKKKRCGKDDEVEAALNDWFTHVGEKRCLA